MSLKESLKESFKFACTPKESAEKKPDTIDVPASLRSQIVHMDERVAIEPPDLTQENHPRICPTCGYTGTGRLVNKGHFLIEIVIWLVALNYFIFVIPVFIAFAFTIWRRSSRNYHCYDCGGLMISTSSPRGRVLFNEYYWRRTVLAARNKEF
jgi:predicted RNA-binding Zn-ribbon protein involved in translation (DUF1610 family)